MQKTAPKKTKYWRNETLLKIGHHAKAIAHGEMETILKIGHHAKAIARAKSSLLGQKLKFQKTCQNPFYKSFTVGLWKNPLQKTLNIGETRPF